MARALGWARVVIDRRLIVVVGVAAFVWAGPLSSREGLASTVRGVWFFDVDHAMGSSNVVGRSAREDWTVNFLNTWGINRIYNSFAAPVPPPTGADLAAWNAKLDTGGITSMLLLSDVGTAADPSFFQDQFIDFNDAHAANEQYKGVKLDIEPHAAGAWNPSDLSLAAAINRRDMLNDLRDTYSDIRTQLDGAGYSASPIYADLAVFFDNIDGFIGWGEGTAQTAAQERDQWFLDINASLDGITMMAFGTPFFNVIESNVNYEINNFGDDVRVALEASIGPSGTFADKIEFFDMAEQIEDYYSGPPNNPSGHTIGIDIQNFTDFFDALLPEPVSAGLSIISLSTLWMHVRRRCVASL